MGERVWTLPADGQPATWKEPDGGGSSTPVNWCVVRATQSTAVTPDNTFYDFVEGDLTFNSQAGSDFSIGTDATEGDGAIISASGGVYQSMIHAHRGGADTVTLDGSSDITRYLSLGLSMGPFSGPDTDLTNTGIDALLPILAPVRVDLTITEVSTPGYIQPGGSVLAGIFANLVAGVGTDSVKLGPFRILVWQTGVLPT